MSITGTNSLTIGTTNVQPSTASGFSELADTIDSLALSNSWAWSNGTGADQATGIWHDQRIVNAGVNDDIDLSGVLTDVFGETITSTIVKALYVDNLNATETDDLEVAKLVTNGWTSLIGGISAGITVRGGGTLYVTAPGAIGYAVAAGTDDILRIRNPGGNNITYNIAIIFVGT